MTELILSSPLPKHIAIIMDGNGRWANKKGEVRLFGHNSGVSSVREVTERCAELGIPFLTLYAFSTENWGRPKDEIFALMSLLVNTVNNEIDTLMKNNIKLTTIGDLSRLPIDTIKAIEYGKEQTKNNDRLVLTLALNYGARQEIVDAVKKITTAVINNQCSIDDINSNLISHNLYTHNIPDPDLMIRTSGEYRLSNFLLWQSAYTELYFSPIYWPDFDKIELDKAILSFQNRERRFGSTCN